MIRSALVSALLATTAVAAPLGPAHATSGPDKPVPGCKVGVWAENFTDAGQLAWQRSLPVPTPYDQGDSLTPVTVGGVSVFADGNALYGLRFSDGRTAWRHTFPDTSTTLTAGTTGTIESLAIWKDSVIVLLGTSSDAPSMVALNAATGAVRWRVEFGDQELEVDSPVITSDGVAAIFNRKDTVQTFDLSTGKHLWSRTYRKDPGVEAEGSRLIIGSKTSDESPTTLHGVVARTGHTAWARSGFPSTFEDQPAPDGILLGYGATFGIEQKVYPVLAVSAATGKTLWQLRPSAQVTAVWAAPAGVVVATGYPGQVYVADPTARLYVAGLKTGQVRWSVKGAHSDPEVTPVITASEITSVASTPDTGTVVNWNAKTGTVRWKAPITDVMLLRYLAQPQGPDVIAVFPGKSDSAHSRLLSINVATGKAKATGFLPYTAAVDAAPAVSGSHVLLEPESVSCAPPVHP